MSFIRQLQGGVRVWVWIDIRASEEISSWAAIKVCDSTSNAICIRNDNNPRISIALGEGGVLIEEESSGTFFMFPWSSVLSVKVDDGDKP